MIQTRTSVTDANGAAFLLVRGPVDFAAPDIGAPVWDPVAQVLRMPHVDTPRLADVGRAAALDAWAAAMPLAEDGAGQFARLRADGGGVEHSSLWPMDDTRPLEARIDIGRAADIGALLLDPVTPPEDTVFADLAIGGARLAALYRADGRQGVVLIDLDRRWQRTVPLSVPATRVWVDRAERVWAASDTDLMLVDGRPLPQPYHPRPDRFEPIRIEPDPPREIWRRLLPDGWSLLAMAADADRLHLLAWRAVVGGGDGDGDGAEQAIISRVLGPEPEPGWDIAVLPADLPFATDLRPVAVDAVALMLPADPADAAFRNCDLPVVVLARSGLGAQAAAALSPRRWPQPSQAVPRFTSDAAGRTRIVTGAGPRGLYPLAQARHAPESVATLSPLDTGAPGAAWHRLYLDACVPPGCAIDVAARAFDSDTPEGPFIPQPAPLWSPLASELGFDAGRLAREPGRQGLFEVQLQRDEGALRRLTGRRLQLRLTLRGDGRHSPAVAAIRVYHPRNSWQDQFLPDHFRQTARPEPGSGPANGADFRERMLASFEGMFTPIENRIAAAECWLSPDTAPEDHLDRLAGMLGARLPAHWPVPRRRRWIAATPELQRTRGTLAGLTLALDIATDGAVARGHVVPVETYRLRRTAATILGLDVDDSDHPLTLGTQLSGNAIVGPSLILSEDTGRDFLALFAPELARGRGDRRAVETFFDSHAHRVDIVLHGPARPYRSIIAEVLPEQIPAGVVPRVIETDLPFVLGLSPLLGIDTLLDRSPAWRRVILDDTYLGREGVLQGPAAFAPDVAGHAESLAALMARTAAPPVEGDAP